MAVKTFLIILLIFGGVIFVATQVEADSQAVNSQIVSVARQASVTPATLEPSSAPTDSPSDHGQFGLFIIDSNSEWTGEEVAAVNQVLAHTFRALEEAGLDGPSQLAGYRFRRVRDEHIDKARGLVGLVNHDTRIITLADAAFQRLGGFYIYHELGHVVDHQLGREMSDNFHKQAGGPEWTPEAGAPWQTVDGYWLRAQAYEDREEATADAFALWVGSEQAGLRRPIFAGQPLDADYEAITIAMERAISAINPG